MECVYPGHTIAFAPTVTLAVVGAVDRTRSGRFALSSLA